MRDLSNFVRIFNHQSFALHTSLLLQYYTVVNAAYTYIHMCVYKLLDYVSILIATYHELSVNYALFSTKCKTFAAWVFTEKRFILWLHQKLPSTYKSVDPKIHGKH